MQNFNELQIDNKLKKSISAANFKIPTPIQSKSIPIGLNGDGLELSVLKKAEKENLWIIRIIERAGRGSEGFLDMKGTLTECNLMEWNNVDTPVSVKGKIPIRLAPFEIKTYKITA